MSYKKNRKSRGRKKGKCDRKSQSKLWCILRRLNPWFTYNEQCSYGENSKFLKTLFFYFLVGLAAYYSGVIFKLELSQRIIMVIYGYICTPYILIGRAKSRYYEKRFWDVNKYMEKMLYYFKNKPKLLECWIMIIDIFPNGEMNEVISEAINHVKVSDNLETGKEESIKIFSKRYECSRLLRIHEFFMQVEHDGGNYDMSIELLLKDRHLWAERVEELQHKKKFTRINVILSMIIVSVLCLSIMYLPGMIASNVSFVDIGKIGFVQISAMLYLMLMLFLYLRMDKRMCVDWLKDENYYTEEEARIRYEKITNKNTSLTARISRHTLSYHALVKVYKKQLKLAMPVWVMRLALLLQTENVHVAIRESYEDAPACLKPAIRKLINEIEMEPNSELPYDNFLEEFEMPEFENVMGTLYSIQSGAGGDVEMEIRNIVDRATTMTDKAEKIKNEDKMAAMQTYVALPGLIGAVKLMIDMSAFLISFLSIRVL